MSVNEKFPLALPSGTVLAGQYTIDEVLGQGGFGITYKATDYKTKEKVAIKEFFPAVLAYREGTSVISYSGERTESYQYGKEAFLKEAQTLAKFIGCDSIVGIHNYFEENDTAYFVMDYVEGKSFEEYLKEKGKISFEEAKEILVPIMDSLAVVHSKGIIHRDVTPDNIFITNDGVVKLLDFGAARYSLDNKSKSYDVILKPGFAPKEQYIRRGKQGAYTDVYSLGATFYFALTGKRPPDSIDRLDDADLIPPSRLGVKITEAQEDAIFKALEVRPFERYQSMTEFKNALINEQVTDVGLTQMARPTSENVSIDGARHDEDVNDNNSSLQTLQNQVVENSKKKNKKLLIIAIVVVICIVAVAIAVIVPTIIKTDNTAETTQSEEESGLQETTTQETTTQETTTQETTTQEQTTQPSTTEQPTTKMPTAHIQIPAGTTAPEETTAVQTGKESVSIIGNRVGNINNGGVILASGSFCVDDDGMSIYCKNEDNSRERIEYSSNGKFSNLIKDGDNLYFICGSKIYMHIISAKKRVPVVALEKYSADYMRLYLSEDYYFVYTRNEGETYGTVYRVSIKTGKEEQSIRVGKEKEFIFWDDYLYYVDNSSDVSRIRMVSSADFNEEKKVYRLNDGGKYSCLTASDEYIYVVASTASVTNIVKFTSDFSKVEKLIKISDECKKRVGDTFEVSTINVIKNQIFICVKSGPDSKPGMFHLTDTEEELLWHEASNVGYGVDDVCIAIKNDRYDFYYLRDGELKYVMYDLNGNFIKPTN